MTNNTNLVNGGAMPRSGRSALTRDRREFIGGSDARVIMGKDEKALLRLWREKRGEEAPPDLSGVLIVQLGLVTEDLNRAGMSSTPATASRTFSVMRSTARCPGWPPRSMDL